MKKNRDYTHTKVNHKSVTASINHYCSAININPNIVHANLPDVTPEEFFYVQIDIEYRKKWDKSLVNVEILETDPIYSSSSHIIYWEMTYPVR